MDKNYSHFEVIHIVCKKLGWLLSSAVYAVILWDEQAWNISLNYWVFLKMKECESTFSSSGGYLPPLKCICRSFTCYEFKNGVYWTPGIKHEKNQHALPRTSTFHCISSDDVFISYVIISTLSWLIAFIFFSVTLISTGFILILHLNTSFKFTMNLSDTASLGW